MENKTYIVSIKPEAEGRQRIALSNGSLFSFKIGYLPPLLLDENSGIAAVFVEGYGLNDDDEEGFRFASSCLRAEKNALRLIARAEQTVFRLACKLEKRGFDSVYVQAVISRLCNLNLLDDSRYARLWLDSRISRQAASPRRLLASLCAHGINRSDAESALKELLDTETEQRPLERFSQKLKRKHKIENNSDEKSRRTFQFLLKSEGFSSNAIRQFFDELEPISSS
jgi:regulatory protein